MVSIAKAKISAAHDRVTNRSISAIYLGFLRSLGESLGVLSVPKGKGLLAQGREIENGTTPAGFLYDYARERAATGTPWNTSILPGCSSVLAVYPAQSLGLLRAEHLEYPEHREMIVSGWDVALMGWRFSTGTHARLRGWAGS